MKEKRKIKLWPFLFLVVLTVIVGWPLLLRGYFSMHDDLQVMRLFEMEKCFTDGQIPCRWSPDMAAGFGQPMFNFYPPLAYYLGMFFRLLGLSFIVSAKLLFFLGLALSAVSMYILANEFFPVWPSIMAATLFLTAPYHLVDIFVRGALAESWAIAFFPLAFWVLYKMIREEKKSFFIAAVLILAAYFLSHNIMIVVFTPPLVAWVLFWIIREKKWHSLWWSALAFLWAAGLASFFILPAFWERSLVKEEFLTGDYYRYYNHFATWRQLFFDRSWGYGPSRPGPQDDMSFQIGWPHWWLALLAGFLALWRLRKKEFGKSLTTVFFLIIFGGSILMTHAKSDFIWRLFPLLAYVQFPWRFLGIAAFASSFLAAAVIGFGKGGNRSWFFSIAVIFLAFVLNHRYFLPQKYYPDLTDEEKLSGQLWQEQQWGAMLDYLPLDVKNPPTELAPSEPTVIRGDARVSEFRRRSDFWRFTFESVTNQSALVEVPVFDFPRWEILIDQQSVVFATDKDTGLIQLEIPAGKHTIVGWFRQTPLRQWANTISVFSLMVLVLAIIKNHEKMA